MSKSIVEKALLEAEELENTMKSNAKEILSSTMKEEIQELVKESLTEEDDYLEEQEGQEQEVDTEMEFTDDEVSDDMETEDELDLGDELDIEDETEDFASEELPPLDLTSASDEEVLKVFKAMGEDDGIVVTKDEDEITLEDGDEEYLIKLEENKKNTNMKKSNLKEMEDDMSEMEHETMEMEDEMSEMENDTMEGDDVMYEIELDEMEDDMSEMEDDMSEMEDDMSEMEHETMEGHYGGNKGDLRRSAKRDYTEGKYGGNKGDLRRSAKRDYTEGKYGGNKGDERRSAKRDYEEGHYGGNKGDLRRSAKRDYTEMQKYGGNKGDIRRSAKKDYTERAKYGGNKGDIRRSAKKDYTEASRTYGFGAKEGRGLRKAFTNNRNLTLGESKNSSRNMSQNYELLKEEVQSLKSKNAEYKKALVSFKEKLNETAVFNSNLAYATRLFTEHSTTKQEKINILRRFDNVQTLKESKDLYKVVREELSQNNSSTKTKKRNISEAVDRKINSTPRSGSSSKLMETKVYENPQFSRIKDLMSKL